MFKLDYVLENNKGTTTTNTKGVLTFAGKRDMSIYNDTSICEWIKREQGIEDIVYIRILFEDKAFIVVDDGPVKRVR